MRSAAPAMKTTVTQVKKPAPMAVRSGLSRGRSSSSWRRRSRVTKRCSSHGHRYSSPKQTLGNSSPPKNGLGIHVWPAKRASSGGIVRGAPISQPRNQSGCAPLVDCHGSYGPQIQIGLICTSPPSSTSTAATAKNQPSVRRA